MTTRSRLGANAEAITMRRLGTALLALTVAGGAFVAAPAWAGTATTFTAGAAGAPAADKASQATRLLFFKSPSGNIGCLLTRRDARCDILKYSYTPPPKPKWCDFDWGQSLMVRKRAGFTCVSDTVMAGDRVLDYGDSLRRGNKKCTSRRSGMVCRNVHTEHGFRLSRDDVRFAHFFTSPSGNIGCVLTRRDARCDIRKYSYTPPPKPEGCDFDWGQSLMVRNRARFVCVSDTVVIGDRVLDYGDALRRGNKKCTSRRTGMVCRNLDTGHGFRLARADVDRF